jgi:hypothetical protein
MLVYETGPLPLVLATCFDEEDFKRATRNLGLTRSFLNGDPFSYTHVVEQGENLMTILCFNLPEDTNPSFAAGRVVLELTQALETFWDYLGEDRPGLQIKSHFMKNYTNAIMSCMYNKGN